MTESFLTKSLFREHQFRLRQLGRPKFSYDSDKIETFRIPFSSVDVGILPKQPVRSTSR
jgi:hypothetical protein